MQTLHGFVLHGKADRGGTIWVAGASAATQGELVRELSEQLGDTFTVRAAQESEVDHGTWEDLWAQREQETLPAWFEIPEQDLATPKVDPPPLPTQDAAFPLMWASALPGAPASAAACSALLELTASTFGSMVEDVFTSVLQWFPPQSAVEAVVAVLRNSRGRPLAPQQAARLACSLLALLFRAGHCTVPALLQVVEAVGQHLSSCVVVGPERDGPMHSAAGWGACSRPLLDASFKNDTTGVNWIMQCGFLGGAFHSAELRGSRAAALQEQVRSDLQRAALQRYAASAGDTRAAVGAGDEDDSAAMSCDPEASDAVVFLAAGVSPLPWRCADGTLTRLPLLGECRGKLSKLGEKSLLLAHDMCSVQRFPSVFLGQGQATSRVLKLLALLVLTESGAIPPLSPCMALSTEDSAYAQPGLEVGGDGGGDVRVGEWVEVSASNALGIVTGVQGGAASGQGCALTLRLQPTLGELSCRGVASLQVTVAPEEVRRVLQGGGEGASARCALGLSAALTGRAGAGTTRDRAVDAVHFALPSFRPGFTMHLLAEGLLSPTAALGICSAGWASHDPRGGEADLLETA